MGTVTGLTAERMLAIEAAAVVDGEIVNDDLVLYRKSGGQINAGNVRGPRGYDGPASADLAVLTDQAILDVGATNQIRAGRQLAPADFTDMGLSVPLGLWNLGTVNDVSGNGRHLVNKGAVTFINGINGTATTCAQFAGSTNKVLYISDTGAADPFRLRYGSVGCWFRSSRRYAASQTLISKWTVAGNQESWILYIDSTFHLTWSWTLDGSTGLSVTSTQDVVDDRWHHVVCTYNGMIGAIYLDGVLLNAASHTAGEIFGGTAPLNIGGNSGDGSTPSANALFGRVDEAFVTGDVLDAYQVRNLYCTKIAHALGAVPKRASLSFKWRRLGGAWVAGDFPAQPYRLHNFQGYSLTDDGTHNIALTNNNAARPAPGADGTADNAFRFNGTNQSLSSADTSLPSGTGSRSYGAWFRTVSATGYQTVVTWGTNGTGDTRLILASGDIAGFNGADAMTGPSVDDGAWHFGVIVENNSAGDALKRKLYLDGVMVASSVTLNSIVLVGADGFRIGTDSGGAFFEGSIDGVFVTNQALKLDEVAKLYAKGVQTLMAAPRNPENFVYGMTSTDIYASFEALSPRYLVSLGVA